MYLTFNQRKTMTTVSIKKLLFSWVTYTNSILTLNLYLIQYIEFTCMFTWTVYGKFTIHRTHTLDRTTSVKHFHFIYKQMHALVLFIYP